MTDFIKVSRDEGTWLAERCDTESLGDLSDMISLMPDSGQASVLWIMNTVDPDMGGIIDTSVLTAAPPGWKPEGGIDEEGDEDGVVTFIPIRQSPENRAVFCRMVPIE